MIRKLIAIAMLCVVTAQVAAQNTAPPRYGFGNPPPTAVLQLVQQSAGARGEQKRHYYFADADREMPFHLYVPTTYDPAKPTPMVVALHGWSANQDYFFASVPELPALCERYGFIFVAPMGYSVTGWYGAPMSIPGAPPAGLKLPPPQSGTPAEQLRERELSEQDVLNVIAIVDSEYNIDADRTYLMGHSMGGFGAWYLGAKYADKWAALAPMSGINENLDVHAGTLAKLPVLVSVGEQETPTLPPSKAAVETLKSAGGDAVYLEVAGASHGSMVAPATAAILEFFAQQSK
ncbi:MAG: hypothetical protein H6978_06430 [Gammaproteobacteria bacterium]|nr:hypothetical protein [Gammaproteobacteria bacterium]